MNSLPKKQMQSSPQMILAKGCLVVGLLSTQISDIQPFRVLGQKRTFEK